MCYLKVLLDYPPPSGHTAHTQNGRSNNGQQGHEEYRHPTPASSLALQGGVLPHLPRPALALPDDVREAAPEPGPADAEVNVVVLTLEVLVQPPAVLAGAAQQSVPHPPPVPLIEAPTSSVTPVREPGGGFRDLRENEILSQLKKVVSNLICAIGHRPDNSSSLQSLFEGTFSFTATFRRSTVGRSHPSSSAGVPTSVTSTPSSVTSAPSPSSPSTTSSSRVDNTDQDKNEEEGE